MVGERSRTAPLCGDMLSTCFVRMIGHYRDVKPGITH